MDLDEKPGIGIDYNLLKEAGLFNVSPVLDKHNKRPSIKNNSEENLGYIIYKTLRYPSTSKPPTK